MLTATPCLHYYFVSYFLLFLTYSAVCLHIAHLSGYLWTVFYLYSTAVAIAATFSLFTANCLLHFSFLIPQKKPPVDFHVPSWSHQDDLKHLQIILSLTVLLCFSLWNSRWRLRSALPCHGHGASLWYVDGWFAVQEGHSTSRLSVLFSVFLPEENCHVCMLNATFLNNGGL